MAKVGGIAQLGELLPRKQGVIGSIPFTSTKPTSELKSSFFTPVYLTITYLS